MGRPGPGAGRGQQVARGRNHDDRERLSGSSRGRWSQIKAAPIDLRHRYPDANAAALALAITSCWSSRELSQT